MNLLTQTFILFFLNAILGCFSSSPNQKPSDGKKEVISQVKTEVVTRNHETPSYQLDNEIITLNLPATLQEISGLSYASKGDHLFAVNDEFATIYEINHTTGEIVSANSFGQTGDYEGIQVQEHMIYITKSNGDIYAYDRQKLNTTVYETNLNAGNDVEGLGLHADGDKLLVALKGSDVVHKKEQEGFRLIYTFDLTTNSLSKKPLFSIQKKAIESFIESNAGNRSEDETKELIHRAKQVSPSGIETHPMTKDIYILSSVGKTMFVYDSTYQIREIYFLDKEIHYQPEGICFDAKGTLYISNEGHIGSGTIMKYK